MKYNLNSCIVLWIIFQIAITLFVHSRPDMFHGDFSVSNVRAFLTIQAILSIPIYNRKLLDGMETLLVYLFVPILFFVGALNIAYIIYYSVA